ncbi:YchJ family protein [methanotrophic endosymbiont of Bathymodiolus puteoserpentis (Logatchev)]|jgi:SEC-C motif-containing protein|uniref:YchJ family protein n=1 Tax=methanotrophic endosymbiont of Bathymodiolus puteoserpentis (Logatchev) TaxID=343235 RepID=UPI00157B6E33|nr:YchJ family protein [methanotrophic endosymbiont of Bathymodiolus puteoserpentis (Logatchev)]
MTTQAKHCLCGSDLTYDQCCGQLHSGKSYATTAKTLMRSRFTAYAMRNGNYLLQTWDTASRPEAIDFSKETGKWTSLDIISSKKGTEKDNKGIVEFKAYFTQDGEAKVMNEISRFVKKQGHWFYLDGKVKSVGSSSGPVNQGLNAPCTCGSGKKFKRCCGKN